jgi:hypothetical protein
MRVGLPEVSAPGIEADLGASLLVGLHQLEQPLGLGGSLKTCGQSECGLEVGRL